MSAELKTGPYKHGYNDHKKKLQNQTGLKCWAGCDAGVDEKLHGRRFVNRV